MESINNKRRNSIDKPQSNNTNIENINSENNEDLSQYRVETSADINPKKNNKKRINPKSISILEVIKVSICYYCFKKKLSFKEQLIKQSIDLMEKKLDIFIYIRNMILIDIMFKILVDENSKDSINFLSRILVYKKPEQNEKEEEINDFYKPLGRLVDLNKLYRSFYNLEKKHEETRTEIENEIVNN